MSGHSHWAGIKHKKALTDARRAKIFSKLGKLITAAASAGGGNPESNLKLKFAIEQARSFNMPKDNIERAIKRGTGELRDQAQIQEVIYEAFGPGGVMMIIKTLTDNRNRTVNEIKSIISDFGGKLVPPGSVAWNFEVINGEYCPKNKTQLSADQKDQYEKLILALEEQDDVEEIFDSL